MADKNVTIKEIDKRFNKSKPYKTKTKLGITYYMDIHNGGQPMENTLKLILSSINEIKSEINEIKSDIVEIKSEIVEIKSDIVEIKSDIVEIRSDIVEIRSDIVEIRSDIVEINERLDDHDQQFEKIFDILERNNLK